MPYIVLSRGGPPNGTVDDVPGTEPTNDMNRFIALLRGINVGGHRSISMEDLRAIFASAGCGNVTTYIQSGNVIFETSAADTAPLIRTIEGRLLETLGSEASVILRTVREFERIVGRDPFGEVREDAKPYVTFLATKPPRRPTIPMTSSKGDVEIIDIVGHDLFSLSHPYKGRYGFPNAFIEKEFGIPATTRNWTTVGKLLALASR